MAFEHQISKTAYDQKLIDRDLTFYSLLKPEYGSLILGFFLLLLTNLILVTLPMLINGGVTLIEREQQFGLSMFFVHYEFSTFNGIFFSIICLAFLVAVIRTLSRVVIFDVGRRIERDVRGRLFSHISAQDDVFFTKHPVGDLMNRLTNDLLNIRMTTGFAALNIMNIIFVFCFTVPLLLRVDILLATVSLLPFPMVIFATAWLTKATFLATSHYQENLSRLGSHIQENLLGAHTIRLFHQQANEGKRFFDVNEGALKAGLKLARARVAIQPIMRLMIGISVGLVLYVGGGLILAKRITLGDFVEVNARILQLAWPAMSVGFVMSIYSSGRASLSRMNQLLRSVPKILDGLITLESIESLTVKNLKLNKSSTDKEDTISFSLKRGQVLGLAGPSGSYKSTLLQTLLHRNEVPKGFIAFNGVDINEIRLASLYDHIILVSQDSVLFHKSIRENMLFASIGVQERYLNEVVSLLRLDEDFSRFEKGMDTVIGERGIMLSGGQRQRVLLARGLLANRSVLILDDALLSVDADTEHHIMQGLYQFIKDKIVIVASHRLAAIRHADHLLILEQGKIRSQGKHEDLIKTSALYQSLFSNDGLDGFLP